MMMMCVPVVDLRVPSSCCGSPWPPHRLSSLGQLFRTCSRSHSIPVGSPSPSSKKKYIYIYYSLLAKHTGAVILTLNRKIKSTKLFVDVVFTLPRIIKSVVTGQAPFALELRNTPGKKHNKPKVVHAYITADAIHACLHEKHIKVKSGVSLRCARSILVHTSHYSRLEKPTTPLATQERLPRIYCT